MGQKKHVDFISSLIFIALSIFMIAEGFRYHADIIQRLDLAFHESPGFFPVIIGSLMLVCSILLFFRSIKGGALKENIDNLVKGAKGLINKDMGYALIGIAFMALYIFVLLPFLGFIIASVIFLVGIMIYLKATSIPKIIAIALSIVVVAFVVVEIVFRVPLP